MENVKSMTTIRPIKFNIGCYYFHFTLRLFHGEHPEPDWTGNITEDVVIHAEKYYRPTGKEEEINFNGHHVVTRFGNQIHTYWDSPIEGICLMLDYFSNLFNSPPIYKFEIKAIEHLNIGQPVCMTTEELELILEYFKPTAALDIRLKEIGYFRYELPSELKSFSCNSSNWLTKEGVMKMNYEFIDVDVEKFSYQDLSDFATKCIEGGLPALQHCFIEAKDLKRNFKEIADRIKYNRSRSRLEVKVLHKKFAYFSYDVHGIYDYEREDGKTVTICASDERDKHCVLHLYVWTK
ncbi:hypothetical protein CAEBREN_22476 [Caenorhabditis brenneri]|uniref:Sdz-33 F-box domain-containing protein n=1 Tax=Caenorhabditis brenneri TaxID=135651 RepID=G0PH10_CAEBE|nr:hypothetical protein CAEBREN_22476 [Caenorhabditis brenneri]